MVVVLTRLPPSIKPKIRRLRQGDDERGEEQTVHSGAEEHFEEVVSLIVFKKKECFLTGSRAVIVFDSFGDKANFSRTLE